MQIPYNAERLHAKPQWIAGRIGSATSQTVSARLEALKDAQRFMQPTTA